MSSTVTELGCKTTYISSTTVGTHVYNYKVGLTLGTAANEVMMFTLVSRARRGIGHYAKATGKHGHYLERFVKQLSINLTTVE